MCKHISGNYRLDPTWFQLPVDEKKTGDVKASHLEIGGEALPNDLDVSGLPEVQTVHEFGSLDAFIQSNREAEDPNAAQDVADGRMFDITTAEGALEMLTESVQGEVDQFVEHGLKETLDLAKREGGSSETYQRLSEQARVIRELRKDEARFIYEALKEARKTLKALRGEGDPASAKDKLSLGASDRAAKCEAACDALRRAVRNFRYNFDQVSHAENETNCENVSWTRKLRQFFSASHTKAFAWLSRQEVQHFGAKTIEELKKAESEFVWSANALRLRKGLSQISAADVSVTSYKTAKRISDTLHRINEANRQLNGDSFEIYQLQAAKVALEDIARNGGTQTLQFSGGAGGGFSLPTSKQSAAVMAKLKHTVRISGRGDGSITVEVLTEGELGAKVKAGFNDVAKVKLNADGGKTISMFDNRAETFTDVDSAAQYLASGNSGWAAKLSSTAGGRGKLGAIKMAWAKVKSWFSKGKVFDEREYVESMKERNVFKSCDAVLRRRRNAVTSARKTISRWSGGIGGGVDLNLGADILNVGIEGRVEGSADTGTETRYRTYLVDLEETHAGKLIEFYREQHQQNEGEPSVTSFASPKDVLAFLGRPAGEDKAAMRQTAIQLLRLLQTNMESWEDAVNGYVKSGKSPTRDQFAALAASYRDAAQALAAIAEKWKTDLEDGADETVSARFRTLYDRLRTHVQNPGIAFPKDEFLELMEVKVSEVKADQTEKHVTVGLNLDFLKKLEKMLLGLSGPMADIGLSFVTESLRGLTAAAVSGGLGALGAKGSLTYEDILTTPKTDDRRPWANAKRETMNLRLPNNLIFGAVAAMVLHRYLEKLKLPVPEKTDEALQFAKSFGKSAAAAGLKRIFFDLAARMSGKFGAKNISDGMLNSPKEFTDKLDYTPFLETFKDTSGTNFQLNWEEDRLVSVAVGKHELFELNVGFGHIGPIFEFGVKFDRVANTDIRLVEDAPFNSLASICDRHLQNDNVTGLLMFGARNRRAFARIYDVIVAMKPGPGQSQDTQFQQDCEQFDHLMKSMEEAVARERREVRGRGPLAENYQNLQNWLQNLRAGYEVVDDDRKMRQVVDFFKFVSFHYSLDERTVKEVVVEKSAVEDSGRLDGDDMLMNFKLLA